MTTFCDSETIPVCFMILLQNSKVVDDWEEYVHLDSYSDTFSAVDSVSIPPGKAEELAKFYFICECRMNCLSDDVNSNGTFKHFAIRSPSYYKSCIPYQPFATYVSLQTSSLCKVVAKNIKQIINI